MKLKSLFFALLLPAVATAAEMPLIVGVRAGYNTSNISDRRTVLGGVTNDIKTWKPGLTLGAVIDIPLGSRFYLSPAFSYDYRADDYDLYFNADEGSQTQVHGSVHTSWFQIPMLVSYRLGVKFLEFQFDAGPYIAYGLGGKDKFTVTEYTQDDGFKQSGLTKINAFGNDGRYQNLDWGLDFGAGILVCKHYYVGAHYLVGCQNLAKDKDAISRAHSFQWQFSIGYNF